MRAEEIPAHPSARSVVILGRLSICFRGLFWKPADGNRRGIVDEVFEERIRRIFELYRSYALGERRDPDFLQELVEFLRIQVGGGFQFHHVPPPIERVAFLGLH